MQKSSSDLSYKQTSQHTQIEIPYAINYTIYQGKIYGHIKIFSGSYCAQCTHIAHSYIADI